MRREGSDMTRALDITRIVCGVLVFVSGLMGLGIFGWALAA